MSRAMNRTEDDVLGAMVASNQIRLLWIVRGYFTFVILLEDNVFCIAFKISKKSWIEKSKGVVSKLGTIPFISSYF